MLVRGTTDPSKQNRDRNAKKIAEVSQTLTTAFGHNSARDRGNSIEECNDTTCVANAGVMLYVISGLSPYTCTRFRLLNASLHSR